MTLDFSPLTDADMAAYDAANGHQPPEDPGRFTEPGETRTPQRELILTAAADIRPRRVFWLWEGRIALGTLALLAGRQGLGKSTLAYWLAAQITGGTLPGEFHGTARAVLVCATEDSWEHTIVPRLIAAGADLSKVFRVEVLTAEELHVGLALPRDNHRMEEAARHTGAALLLLDPIISRLGDLDTHRDSEVRQALEPLVAVAARTHMAVLGLIHHNKSGAADPLQSVMGSTAFSAVARSVHTVIPDADDDTNTRRLFGTPKNNLGRTDLPTLSFTVESHAVDTVDGTAWTGRINWGEEHEGSIADAMRQARDSADDRSATKEAADWLQDHLSIQGGSDEWKNIKRDGIRAGHSESTLKRAKSKLKLGSRTWGYPRSSMWYFGTEPPLGPNSGQPPWGDGLNELNEPNGGYSVHSGHSVQVRESVNPMDPNLPRRAADPPLFEASPDSGG
jgi:hypothetical protein